MSLFNLPFYSHLPARGDKRQALSFRVSGQASPTGSGNGLQTPGFATVSEPKCLSSSGPAASPGAPPCHRGQVIATCPGCPGATPEVQGQAQADLENRLRGLL